MIGPKLENRDASPLKVLLVRKTFIGDDQKIEASCFSAVEKFTVAYPSPSHLNSGLDLVIRKRFSELNRNRFVEENPHAATTSRSIRS